MKTLAFSLCFVLSLSAGAQGGYNKNDFKTVSGSLFLTTITGEPINTTKYVHLVEGTPYFQDTWMQSIIVLQDGNRTQNIMVKMNLVDNEIYFRDTQGRELVVTQPVKEVVLMNRSEDSLFRFVHGSTLDPSVKKGWYQWLHSGKASLYRYYHKDLFETKNYGSASAEQRVITKEKYFVHINGTLLQVKNVKDITFVLKEKKPELESLIKKLPASGTTEEKLVAAVSFYNSLVSK